MKYDEVKGKALFTNDVKLSLASEIDMACQYVAVHARGYFDSYCTNEACTVIMSKTTDNNTRLERSGLPLFPVHFKMDETAHLDDLEVAAVNNHIGISTLAITNDRYIVIWQQGNLNIQDPGKIVASGSGSCNSTDLCFNSLKETVRTGMERELKEEGLHQVLIRPFLILLQPK